LGALGFSDKSFYGDDYSLFLAKCRAVYSLLNLENKNPPFFCPSQFQSLSSKSFKVLNTTKLDLDEKNIKLPFYSRIEKIEANWFGDGSNKLKEYSPYYKSLILK